MRNNTRVGTAISIALAGVLGVGGAALADGGYPTQNQVDNARQHVASAKNSLAAARDAYSRTQAAAARADQQAEIASEAYNGAMWRLSLARTAAKKAATAAAAAQARVRDQRTGIADLVVRSYQEGADLNGISAFLDSGGPLQALENAGQNLAFALRELTKPGRDMFAIGARPVDPPVFHRCFDGRDQRCFLQRFFQKIRCPGLHRLNGRGYIALAGDDDRGHGRVERPQPPKQFDAVYIGHAQVRDKTDSARKWQEFQKGLRAAVGTNGKTRRYEQKRQRSTERLFVIDEMDRKVVRH